MLNYLSIIVPTNMTVSREIYSDGKLLVHYCTTNTTVVREINSEGKLHHGKLENDTKYIQDNSAKILLSKDLAINY